MTTAAAPPAAHDLLALVCSHQQAILDRLDRI